jgi:hypothetical protein
LPRLKPTLGDPTVEARNTVYPSRVHAYDCSVLLGQSNPEFWGAVVGFGSALLIAVALAGGATPREGKSQDALVVLYWISAACSLLLVVGGLVALRGRFGAQGYWLALVLGVVAVGVVTVLWFGGWRKPQA